MESTAQTPYAVGAGSVWTEGTGLQHEDFFAHLELGGEGRVRQGLGGGGWVPTLLNAVAKDRIGEGANMKAQRAGFGMHMPCWWTLGVDHPLPFLPHRYHCHTTQ